MNARERSARDRCAAEAKRKFRASGADDGRDRSVARWPDFCEADRAALGEGRFPTHERSQRLGFSVPIILRTVLGREWQVINVRNSSKVRV